MDKMKNKTCLSASEFNQTTIKFGEKGSVAIDQMPAAQANINPRTGFAYTDIQKIMIQNDVSERRRLLDNLQQFKADFLPADVTDEQAIASCTPASMQLPSQFAEEVGNRIAKYNERVRARKEALEREQLLKDLADIKEPVKEQVKSE